MKETCEACCEPFNKSNRSKIVCSYCPSFAACASCTERYLLDSSQDAHCMSCRKVWPRSFLAENFTQKFMNKTYKDHRENVLLERERALLPETQHFVELEINIRKCREELARSARNMSQARREFVQARGAYGDDFETAEKNLEIQNETRIKFYKYKALHDNIDEKIKFLLGYRYGTRANVRTHRVFIRACPAQECKGFLSSAWKCGVCDQTTCSDCHEIKTGDDHVCDPNSVETARLLNRDSRPCPNCACLIFKIDGCDQMWCTQCHTAFSWRHGTIVTSIIHNPHYYDYMRANGTLPRNPLDRPCGGYPDWTYVAPLRVPHAIYRLPIHATHILRPSFARRDFDPAHNRELRIKYMLNEINTEKFKILIQRDEKSRQKNNDIYNVLEMFSNVMEDLLLVLIEDNLLEKFMTSFEELRVYVNTSMTTISKNYSNCRVPTIRENLAWDM